MSLCKYCHAQITWREEGGRWKPVGVDGSIHRCPVLVARDTRELGRRAAAERKELGRLRALERKKMAPGIAVSVRNNAELDRAFRERIERGE